MIKGPFPTTSSGFYTGDPFSFGFTYERSRTSEEQIPTLFTEVRVIITFGTWGWVFDSYSKERMKRVTSSSTTMALRSTHLDSWLIDPDTCHYGRGDHSVDDPNPNTYLLFLCRGGDVWWRRRRRHLRPFPALPTQSPDGQTPTITVRTRVIPTPVSPEVIVRTYTSSCREGGKHTGTRVFIVHLDFRRTEVDIHH